MMLVIASIGILAIVLIIISAFLKAASRKSNSSTLVESQEIHLQSALPPSLSRLPVIGNLHHAFMYRRKGVADPHLMFGEMAKELGSTFTFWFGANPVVVINDFDIASKILRSKDFAGRPKSFVGRINSRNFMGIINTDPGPEFTFRCKIAHRIFSRQNMTNLQSVISDECRNTVNRLSEHSSTGTAVDVGNDLSLFAINVMYNFLFGSQLTVDHESFHTILHINELFKKVLFSSNILQAYPFLQKLPIRPVRNLHKYVEVRDGLIRERLREHIETFDAGTIRDVTDALILESLSNKKDVSSLTMDNIEIILSDLYFSGYETVASSLRWLVLYLITNEHVLAKCYEEIDRLLDGKNPKVTDRAAFSYVNAVICETLRKASPAPLAVPHKVLRDTPIGEYQVPKDTTVLINLHAIQHDKKLFSNPDQFVPERFLDGGNTLTSCKGFLAFGDGRRKCLGYQVAQNELFMFLVHFLQVFHVRGEPDVQPSEESIFSLILDTKPYKVVLEKRTV